MRAHQHDENCKEMLAMLSEYFDPELPLDTCRDMGVRAARDARALAQDGR
jgi:metal-sulfur cluster biosynthetic enzyme